ncbi:MAG: arylsulfatase [Opitutaceae bacterium]|nr:arylsulfatase [Opitutaceae bacterium]
MNALRILLLLALSLASLALAVDRPNVVLLLVDDMGYGDPGCYNPRSKIATPHLDRLAREGLRFTDAHAPGAVCHPSRYGLLTGSYPFRTDVSLWPKQPLIKDGQLTIASLLAAAGYRTAMVGKWHLGFDEPGYDGPLRGGPVDRGFGSFFGFRASTDIPPYFYISGDRAVAPPTATIAESRSHPSLGGSPVQGEYWRGGGIAPGLMLQDVLPRFTTEAVRIVREHGQSAAAQPFFLYLALTGPHTPWLPSPEFKGRSAAGRYGDFAMMVDAAIGLVLQALDDTGQAGNTLVVVTSDNGPVWYPADTQRTGHDSTGGFRGMKGSNWEAGHRVPFIVRWPGKTKAGGVTAQTICFTDVLATFAAIVGRALPADAAPDSFSFLPVLLGRQDESDPVRPNLVVGQSYRSGPWKWIEARDRLEWAKPESGTYPGRDEPPAQLYHLGDDPHETKNLATARPEIAVEMRNAFARIREGPRTRP